MNMPNNFLDRTNITREVVFVGQGDRIRLWDNNEYETYLGSMGGYGEYLISILEIWRNYSGTTLSHTSFIE